MKVKVSYRTYSSMYTGNDTKTDTYDDAYFLIEEMGLRINRIINKIHETIGYYPNGNWTRVVTE